MFGTIKDAVFEIKTWMNMNPTEIVVLYFGNMFGNVIEGHKELRSILKTELNGIDGNVGLNNHRQTHQEWPTLGQAKETNQRIFAVARTKTGEQAINFVGSKVLPEKQYKYDKPAPNLGNGILQPRILINILSTHRSMNIGTDCKNIVTSIGEICSGYPEADFVKLAIFGTHGGLKNSGLKCLSTLASKCNPQVKNAIDICRSNGRENINFLQTDYPNHPGAGLKTVVEIAQEENHNNLELFGY